MVALLTPTGIFAARPGTVTTCSVSSGVTQTTARAKGKLTGTSGADSIDCSALTNGSAVINGGGGSDSITGTPFADVLDDGATGPGSYTSIDALGGNDIIRVGWGVYSNESSASVDAGPGDDQIVANGGFVNAAGRDGNDLLDLSNASAAIADGGAGNDTITGPALAIDDPSCLGCYNALDGGDGDDVVIGGAGRDEIGGGPGVDEMHAGSGNDSITDYASGAELFDCGDGADLAGDYDGNGVATDGTVGYLNAPEDDTHLSCETVRVAVSGP